ncbi:2-desacetyl-2-hydroxyethyl bacteriochlorophyllide A dehydrogenase [Blastococcus colisei]|uniref:2-desacetyl-2-hydroxyethyl bacteriochlorophyllide A dehydrogenase n=1 Tax=Blastococcus colisei TaxID=1564162 RepID=A0A543PG55_9ACTN|nr:zinc-binding dehydrogenase [Blastococcus colisei]TQN43058.1 2-desacetyl-2-hydroxyethyl bacteriochlorophyllide A dehydrogenase [Blastococcus colisei]
MRAVRFHRHGGPEVLQVEELPVPEPAAGQVLVKVAACGVNRVDILSREGQTPAPIVMPHVSGTEVTGEVAAVGAGVDLPMGMRVLVNPTISCGRCEFCRAGRDNACLRGRIFGVQTDGGYASHVVVEAQWLLPLPDDVSFEDGAAVAVTGATAWHMLVTRAGVRVGHDVLVIAGGSGIGALGIQIAKLAGARVITTAGSGEKRERALALGADEVVDHYDPDWPRTVRRLTGGRGVDVVFEHVGQATWAGSLTALTRGGTLVTCGGHSGFTVEIDLWSLFVKEHKIVGSFAGTTSDLLHVLELVGQRRLRPVVHDRIPLAEAARAQQLLEDSAVFGKVLLLPEHTHSESIAAAPHGKDQGE